MWSGSRRFWAWTIHLHLHNHVVGHCTHLTGENNGESTGNDGNKTSGCANKDVVCAHPEKIPAAKQCIIEAQTAMSMKVHQSHELKGGAKSGRTSVSLEYHPQPRIIGIT